MTKTSKNAFVPIILILLLVLAGGYFVFKDKITDFLEQDNSPTITRLDGFPTIVYRDDNVEKQRRIITSQEELNEFLNFVDTTGLLILRNEVNFDKQVLLGVSTATDDYTNQKVKIKKAYEDKENNTLLVVIEETKPGKTCEVELDKNIAVDLVAISKTNLEITFDKVQKIEECN